MQPFVACDYEGHVFSNRRIVYTCADRVTFPDTYSHYKPRLTRENNLSYSKNINALQILRAIAALMVVVWHSNLAIKNTVHDYWINGDALYRAAHYLSPLNHLYFGVDIFFCISGYIMYMLIEKTPPNIEASFKFLLDRAIRILPPYWLFTALVVVAYLASRGHFNVGHLTGDLGVDVFRFLTSILMFPQPHAPILGVGWTLVHETLFYLICGLVGVFGLNRRLPEVLATLSIVAIVLAVLDISIFYGYGFSPYYIEFFFGAMAYRFSNRVTAYPILTIFTGLGCYFTACYILDSQVIPNITFITRQLFGGLFGFFLISGLIAADRKYLFSTTNIGNLFMRIGDASYTLYLLHWFVLSIMGKIIGLTPEVPLVIVATWHVLSVITAITLSVFFAEKVELPFHRWFRQRIYS